MAETIPRCPYCQKLSVLIDSSEVYRQSHGNIWICRPCKAWVGVHQTGDLEDIALGTLANEEARLWRQKAHAVFDPLWEAKIKRHGVSKNKARRGAYKWLAKELDIDYRKCHIARMQKEECQRVIEVCSKCYKKVQ